MLQDADEEEEEEERRRRRRRRRTYAMCVRYDTLCL
jgi:hypothetical protein